MAPSISPLAFFCFANHARCGVRCLYHRTIYDNLSKVGDAETQETFKQRVQEIEPTIRFCNYNLSQGEDLSGLKGSATQAGADVLLQAKLDVRGSPEAARRSSDRSLGDL